MARLASQSTQRPRFCWHNAIDVKNERATARLFLLVREHCSVRHHVQYDVCAYFIAIGAATAFSAAGRCLIDPEVLQLL